MITPADLVFLEPNLLLVEDPSAVGPRTWHAIRRVAKSISQLMTGKHLRRAPGGSYVTTQWKDNNSFCDVVPVSSIGSSPLLALFNGPEDLLALDTYMCLAGVQL